MNKIYNFLHRHRYDFFFSLLLILIFSFVFIVIPTEDAKNIIRAIENKTFDLRQNIISKDKQVRDDIIIITVDDPSYEFLLEKYGDWPIPRSVYADIVSYIQAQNPKFIAFDLLFVKSLKRVPHSDAKLVQKFKEHSNIYAAMNFDDYDFEIRKPPVLDKKFSNEVQIENNSVKPYLFTNSRIIMNEIMNATDKIGHINTPKSDDGFIRTIPLIVNYPRYNKDNSVKEINSYIYMTAKIAIDYLNKYENANIKELKIDKNRNLMLGNRKIPLTQNAEVILNWYGESGLKNPKTFKYISLWKVIESIEAEKEGTQEILPEDLFKDKIVYIGTNVFSLSDIKPVPTSRDFPGVEIHTTLLNNIIDNNLIKKATLEYDLLITVLLSIAAAFTVFKIRSVLISIIMFSILMFSYLYFSTYAMSKYNIWIWVIIPLIMAILSFICAFIIKYLIKSRDFEYTYKLATTDGLTELYNHRFFQETMKNKIEKAEKNNSNFSLILIDIDFFKKFNDKYGHQAGDAVLKHVSKTLKSCVRTEDYVCRYGGEEMTIILNKTDKQTAINIAEKICKTIASKRYELSPELEVNITVSLGTSTFPENGQTPATLIEYADKCLYKAKENGRNQVGFIEN